MIKSLQIITYPISLAYGLAGWMRNKLFDWNALPRKAFGIPVIAVGNLSSGGTGKTPHVEYLIRLLTGNTNNICVLSRGYGRKTRGYKTVTENSLPEEAGDEPCQIARKFPHVKVAVCESRVKGARTLMANGILPGALILDDAFQHRYIKPGLSILLTDFFHPYYKDYVLPSGRLREFRKGAKRADIIVMTKCPVVLSPILRKSITQRIAPRPGQKLFFSYFNYGELIPANARQIVSKDENRKYYAIVLFTGIANAYPLEEHLRRSCIELVVLRFPDHHNYSHADMLRIRETFLNIVGKNKILVTTEKDRVRVEKPDFQEMLSDLPLYYQPVEVDFFAEDKAFFDRQITDFAKNEQG
jgi:tetraacyldisaccharide 4'-kinase